MLKTTFIARASDGLILCETYDTVTDSQGITSISTNSFTNSWKNKAKCKSTS